VIEAALLCSLGVAAVPAFLATDDQSSARCRMTLAISAHPQCASLKIPRWQFIARERAAVRDRVICLGDRLTRFAGRVKSIMEINALRLIDKTYDKPCPADH
jgi:hypothetical protein